MPIGAKSGPLHAKTLVYSPMCAQFLNNLANFSPLKAGRTISDGCFFHIM